MKILENSCRVCLKTTDATDSDTSNDDCQQISIEETDNPEENISISEKITLCTGVMIDSTHFLAKNICKICHENLRSAYNFRNTCKNSDIVLQEYINNTNFVVEEEFIEEHLSDADVEIETEGEILYDSNEICPKFENLYPTEIDVKIISISDKNSKYPDIRNNQCSIKNNKINMETKLQHNKVEGTKIIFNYESPQLEPTNTILWTNTEEIESETNNLKKMAKKDERDTFVCELCGNVYRKRALLSDHMRWHSGEKEFQCEICEKSFLLATYLARHMKTHTGIRNFHCSYCSRTFYTNGLKRSHEKVHTGERQYSCQLCNRTFSYSQSLQRHMMVHSGVKPFKCEDCGKEFRQETHLKQHLSTNLHQAKTMQFIH